jgi:hypothetical protein
MRLAVRFAATRTAGVRSLQKHRLAASISQKVSTS